MGRVVSDFRERGTEMEKNHHAQCMMPDFFFWFGKT